MPYQVLTNTPPSEQILAMLVVMRGAGLANCFLQILLMGGPKLRAELCHAVGGNGDLKPVADEWTRGNYPRSFAFDPTGEFLYCCNQRADHVTVFRADRKTGLLAFTGQYVPVGNPSCVVFLDLKPKA